MNPLSWITSALGGVWGYAAAAVLSAAIVGSGVGYVVHRMDAATINEMKLADAKAEAAAYKQGLALQKNLDAATQLEAVAEATAQQQIVTQTVTVTKEIPRYVTVHQDAVVCVPYGFVRLLYSAERGLSPAALGLPPGQSDDACTGLKLSDLAAGLTADYGASRANSEQLDALIASVKQTDAIQQAQP